MSAKHPKQRNVAGGRPTSKAVSVQKVERSTSVQLLVTRFPNLATSTAVGSDVEQDLVLTEAQFGSKYRKGKKKRLGELQTMETALHLEKLKGEIALLDQVRLEVLATLRAGGGRLRSVISSPRTYEQAEMVFRLWFLGEKAGLLTSDVSLDLATIRMQKLTADDIDTQILRNYLLSIGGHQKIQEIAKRHSLARQSVYARVRRILSELEQLAEDKTFRTLIEEVRSLSQLSGDRYRVPLSHPLMGISLMENDDPIGSISDVIRVAILCAASQSEVGSSATFRKFRWAVIEEDGRPFLELA